MKKIVLGVISTAIIVSSLLGIAIIAFGIWNELTARVLGTTAVLFGYSILGLGCFSIFERAGKRIISEIGIIICLLSCIWGVLNIWVIDSSTFFSSFNWKIIFSSIFLSIAAAHICLMLLIEETENSVVNIFKYLTISAVLIFTINIVLATILDTSILPWQMCVILLIVSVMGTIVTPVMYKATGGNKQQKEVPQPQPEMNKYDKLYQLKKLLDSCAITQEEYVTEKEKILNEGE